MELEKCRSKTAISGDEQQRQTLSRRGGRSDAADAPGPPASDPASASINGKKGA